MIALWLLMLPTFFILPQHGLSKSEGGGNWMESMTVEYNMNDTLVPSKYQDSYGLVGLLCFPDGLRLPCKRGEQRICPCCCEYENNTCYAPTFTEWSTWAPCVEDDDICDGTKECKIKYDPVPSKMMTNPSYLRNRGLESKPMISYKKGCQIQRVQCRPRPLEGEWGSWRVDPCSSSCVVGTQLRSRDCLDAVTNETVNFAQCEGGQDASYEEVPCNTDACETPSDWIDVGQCFSGSSGCVVNQTRGCFDVLSIPFPQDCTERTVECPSYCPVPFLLIIVTGDRIGGDTNATVTVTLHGDVLNLTLSFNSTEHPGAFTRGNALYHEDMIQPIGAVTSLVIGHDDTGNVPAWFMEAAYVYLGPAFYFFPCGTWFDSSIGDRMTTRTLFPGEPCNQENFVYAWTPWGACSDSCMPGIRMREGFCIDNTTKDDSFYCAMGYYTRQEESCNDHLCANYSTWSDWTECSVVCRTGNWSHTRACLDDTPPPPGCEFEYGICDAGPCTVSFNITIVTGDIDGAGTDATVTVTLFGDIRIETLSFNASAYPGNFSRGSTFEYAGTIIEVGNLDSIIIGLDNTGSDPDWYMESFSISFEMAESLGMGDYDLPCLEWFGTTVGNRLTSRTFFEGLQCFQDIARDRCIAASQVDLVFILDESGSVGYDNFQLMKNFVARFVERLTIGPSNILVGLIAYGRSNNDQWQLNTYADDKQGLLSATRNLAYASGTATYTDSALDFAATTKFTPSVGKRANVPAATVLMTDGHSSDSIATGAMKLRNISRVIALGIANANLAELEIIASTPDFVRTVDNFDELDAIIELTVGSFCSPRVISFILTIVTSDIDGAGTDATVDATLNGDTGNLTLSFSSTEYPGEFQRNHVFAYNDEILEIGILQSLIMSHDSTGPDQDWHLQEVTINLGNEEYDFPCNEWFDSANAGGGLTTREMIPGEGCPA